MEWVGASLANAALLREVKEATRRISTLVAAVRSYSQMDRASLQTTDLVEGLDSTLVMLAHKLGDTHGRRGLHGQVIQQPAIVAGILLVAAALADVDDANQFALADQGDDHGYAFFLQLTQSGRVEVEPVQFYCTA